MPSVILSELAGFLPFAAAMSFSPGPNNLMLANSGARFGFARSIPLACGVVVGFAIVTLVVAAGSAGVLAAAPAAFGALRFVAVAYFVYLAWRTAMAGAPRLGTATERPVGFVQGSALQAVNPKAWIMAIGAITAYAVPGPAFRTKVIFIVATFAAVGVGSTCTWAAFGQLIRHWLRTPLRWRVFNGAMALLLLASLIPILAERP